MRIVPLTVLAALCSLHLHAQVPADRRDYITPSEADHIVHGDFNNDGIEDIAVDNSGSSGASVFLGRGNGTFQPVPLQVAGGLYPEGIVAADFNGDGNLDLVLFPISISLSSPFELSLGNGDGTFQPPQEITVPIDGTVANVVAADLNHDGHPDLLFAATGQSAVIIVLGNGDGTFGPAQSFSGGYFTLGDFNHDGNLDIATSFLTYTTFYNVYLGNGDGTFQSVVRNQAVGAPLASADLNGDGLDDLILDINEQHIATALSNGDGTFATPTYIPLGESHPSVYALTPAVADLNGDGKADLLVIKSDLNGQTSECCSFLTLVGNGDGTFRNERAFQIAPFASQVSSTAIAVADFNRDGIPDVATPGGLFSISEPTPGSVSVLQGTGDGGFAAPRYHFRYGASNAPNTAAPVAVGDTNHDGTPDAVVLYTSANQVAVFPGQGTINYFSTGSNPVALALVDVNHDGNLDILTANAGSGDVSLLLGTPSGQFNTAQSIPVSPSLGALVVADFNADGNPDVAVTDTQSNTITILIGNGHGGFTILSGFTLATTPGSLAAGDLNHDGIVDLAVTSATGSTVSIFLGDGTGNFTASSVLPTPLPALDVKIADLNANGVPHLIVTAGRVANNSSAFLSDLLIASSSGDGTFTPWTTTVLPAGPATLLVTDLNHDGLLDIVTGNRQSNDVSVLLGNASSTYNQLISLGADYNPSGIAAADFNSDGKPDIVISDPTDNRLTVLLNILGGPAR